MSFALAEKFVEEKSEWIRKARAKALAAEKSKTIFTDEGEFRTKFRSLKLLPEPRTNLKLNVTDKFIEIGYPESYDLRDERLQETIRKAMEHAWKIEAYEYLPKRMEQLATKHGLKFEGLTVKNSRSFWGNCSRDDYIVLSLHLMHLPDELIDYVILHELCHTVHKNHGERFWALLDKLTDGRAKYLDKKMKEHSTKGY
jgi:predicted metal-dependent hydrolase